MDFDTKDFVFSNQSDDMLKIVKELIRMEAINRNINDKENGQLYAELFKDKHRYNATRRKWMYYDGTKWTDDIEGMEAKQSAKMLSDALLECAMAAGSDGFLKEVLKLTDLRRRTNMLKDAESEHFIKDEQLDTNDYLVNTKNCVLDLSGSSVKVLEHDPDMLLSKSVNAEYNKYAVSGPWIDFVDDIMQGDKEKIDYLQKIAGLALTGSTSEEACYILYGKTTRNGKSTFCEALLTLLGDYGTTVKPETLAEKQNNDSRVASPDIAKLAGVRFVNTSEPRRGMLIDAGLLKEMTGRDAIVARQLHQSEFSFKPKFTLVMNTNHLPKITDRTVFNGGRINVVTFDRHFSKKEQDKTLKTRLCCQEQLSGILSWCIEGYMKYKKEGMIPPNSVEDATNEYEEDSDKLGCFISACLTEAPGNCMKAKDGYELYKDWCDSAGFGCESKSGFFSMLKERNIFAKKGKVRGVSCDNVIKGYKEVEKSFEPCINTGVFD